MRDIWNGFVGNRLMVKVNEILTEMVFERKFIIARINNLSDQITDHAVKLICLPSNQEVRHWQAELIAWGNRLAAMRVATKRNPPIGVPVAVKLLYTGPFEGNELAMTQSFTNLVTAKHDVQISAAAVHPLLREVLINLATAIGNGVPVTDVVQSMKTL